MTYGDGLSDINLKKLRQFHLNHRKIASVTAVRPPVRFGEMSIINSRVSTFKEKPEIKSSWINGGFFVLNYKIFNFIKNDSISFEKQPLEKLSIKKNLMAYKHYGFWKCMDNLADKNYLDHIFSLDDFVLPAYNFFIFESAYISQPFFFNSCMILLTNLEFFL